MEIQSENEKGLTPHGIIGSAIILVIGILSYVLTGRIFVGIISAISIAFVWFSKADKTQHFYAGTFIAVVLGSLLYRYIGGMAPGSACISGTLTGIAVGFAKDFIWDKIMGKGVFSWWDITLTAMGSIFGGILLRVCYAVLLGEGVSLN